MKKGILILLIVLVIAQVAAIFWFKTNESDLLFDPLKETLTPIPYSDIEYKAVDITTKDSVTLKGWEIYAANNDSTTPWLIYFHDCSQTVSSSLKEYLQLRNLGMNILAIDYRGFGESDGEISEEGMYLDADAIYYYIRYKKSIPFNRIIIYGEGVGTSAAIDMGQNVNAGAIVLVNPFTKASELLQSWYPFAWPNIFGSLELNSLDKIKNINTPKFLVTIPEKSCMPTEHCDQLFNRSKKYHWRLEAEPSLGINNFSYYNSIFELLNKNARFTLWEPSYSLADTIFNTINTQGIENALRHFSDLKLTESASYDFSEYQLDMLGDWLHKDNKMQEALEIYKLNSEAYPQSKNAGAKYSDLLMELKNK